MEVLVKEKCLRSVTLFYMDYHRDGESEFMLNVKVM